MSSPKELRYTKTHEWVKLDGEFATIGVTDFAQNGLGEVTYLELPDLGTEVSDGEPFGALESVKAASDVYSPLDGEIVERNEDAITAPDIVNSSPYEGAWLIKVKLADPGQIDALLTAEQYDELLETVGDGH